MGIAVKAIILGLWPIAMTDHPSERSRRSRVLRWSGACAPAEYSGHNKAYHTVYGRPQLALCFATRVGPTHVAEEGDGVGPTLVAKLKVDRGLPYRVW